MRRSLPAVLVWLLLAGGPALAFAWLQANDAPHRATMAPAAHFYIVSATAVLSAALALVMAAASVRVANARTLLLTMAFVAMAAIFAVHGLATPGFLLGGAYYDIAAVSARMSITLAACFLGASAVAWPARAEQLLVRWRLALLGLEVVLVAGFAFLALARPQLVPHDEFETAFFLQGTLWLVLALTAFAAWRYLRAYRRSGLTMFGAVALGAVLLFEAQVAMHYGTVWHHSWWIYHAQLFAAFLAIVGGIATEYTRGSSPLLAAQGLSLRDPVAQIQAGYATAISALAAALEARDGYTHGHGRRVAALSVLMAEHLRLAPGRVRALAQGALLHDVGKIAVPDHILHKPGPLSHGEFDEIKCHPGRGEALLAAAFPGRIERAVIRHHHERWDGTGYPDGLRGAAIPLEARIAAVADVYDALRSTRAYREAWAQRRTLAHMESLAGSHLDPYCLDALFAVVERWERNFSADAEAAAAEAQATEAERRAA
jgi:HD-GYP domain-containing protein (c-di-GMP phosphodiesterase class II)